MKSVKLSVSWKAPMGSHSRAPKAPSFRIIPHKTKKGEAWNPRAPILPNIQIPTKPNKGRQTRGKRNP